MYRVFLFGEPLFLDETTRILVAIPGVSVVGTSSDLREGRELIEELEPNVVIVNGAEEEDKYAGLPRYFPRAIFLLAVERPGAIIMRKARSYGYAGILQQPIDAEELINILKDLREEEERRLGGNKEHVEEIMPKGKVSGKGAFTPTRQEVIVIYSPKGGVGKTSLAINLAAAYAKTGIARVVLLDFDVYGNVASSLGAHMPTVTTANWVEADNDLDQRSVERRLLAHSSGMMFLPAPKRLEDASLLDEPLAVKILQNVKKYFDIIIVDAGPALRDATVAALDMATRVYLMGTLDVPTLRSLNDIHTTLEQLQVDLSKIRIVLNRIPKKPDISIKEASGYLKFPVLARLPEDPDVQRYVNQGLVLMISKPDSPFAVEVRKLTGMTGKVREQSGRWWPLRLFFRKRAAI